MKRILKTRTFNRWLRKTLLSNTALLKAIAEMERGLVDADLGCNVYKKRVACQGGAKAEVPEHSLPQLVKTVGFLCTGLKKMIEKILHKLNWPIYKALLRFFLPIPVMNYSWP